MTLKWTERVLPGLLLVVFSICLPTWDSVYDVYFSIFAIINGELAWGIALLVPVIVNMFFTGMIWYKTDQGVTWKEDKRWTWVLVLLTVWPQWRALNLFYDIVYKGEDEALQRKEAFERRAGGLEPFLESAPQVILSYISLVQ